MLKHVDGLTPLNRPFHPTPYDLVHQYPGEDKLKAIKNLILYEELRRTINKISIDNGYSVQTLTRSMGAALVFATA